MYTPQSYGMSPVIWDHTVLPDNRHRWTHPPNPSQKGWYTTYLPRRDGRVSWPRWLVTYGDSFTHPQAVTNQSINRTRRRVTTFIKTNALPLSQATTTTVRPQAYVTNNLHACMQQQSMLG